MRQIKIIFWLHFMFAAASHVLVPMMLIGTIELMITWQLGLWLSGLVLGATLFSVTYLVNHVSNPNGFCVLTDLENHYRREEGLSEVGSFLPRFYAKCKELFSFKGNK